MNNFNEDIENAVLGALLLEPDAYDKVSAFLTAESFYNSFHRIVFSSVVKLKQQGKHVDILTVTQELKKINPAQSFAFEVANLTTHVAAATNIQSHALILKELQTRRELIHTAREIEIKAEKGAQTDELISLFDQRSQAIKENSVVDSPVNLKNAVFQTVDELKQASTQGLSTGFPKLDKFFGGLRAGRVFTLGGRPAMGKTSVAMFMALANVAQGKKVVFFSAEQDVKDLTKKILAGQSGIGHNRLDAGNLNASEWGQIDSAIEKLLKLPGSLFLKSNPKSIQHVAAMVRNQRKKTGLDLVVIDYLQLLPSVSKSKNNNREREVAEISRTIKQLALAEQVAILELSQLNREVQGEPKLSQLRESGAIEQDADVVMFVHRPSVSDNSNYQDNYGEIIIAKNRRGELGKMAFYHKNMASFSDEPIPGNRPF